MTTKEQVQLFLSDFKIKMKTFVILFRDERKKNTQALLQLEIPPAQRRKIIESLSVADYAQGPLDDTLFGIASMWVFGKQVKQTEYYIKISMGLANQRVICISFHPAQHPLSHPFK
ncbi:hypothetical protein [Rufibacter immobilis]|uniref:hypothetical protein n=1 Tax=Rufibacter immobilis TaxID=1348778 RepID=UPI0035F0566B